MCVCYYISLRCCDLWLAPTYESAHFYLTLGHISYLQFTKPVQSQLSSLNERLEHYLIHWESVFEALSLLHQVSHTQTAAFKNLGEFSALWLPKIESIYFIPIIDIITYVDFKRSY